ncbi:DUF4270 domain-containing protein [Polaribacter haliotis]|uniref:DUF4270 domain-containing protein n=1 Tax=Polaribacter haliotis TaxID=1888915 RepID=A0A7L8AD58_9FLAO|nr:DUF4270 family protein [Polaribacter haliotis]QOD59940.1 DUF4270 domain-containing protein [Polaribacter haliotis]
MVKNSIRKTTQVGVLFLLFAGIISCEKDFTDIGTGVVSNTKFTTHDTILEVLVSNAPIENVRADGLDLGSQTFFGRQGQYLLGVHSSSEYEKIEASIISQISINTELNLNSYANPDELDFETSVDTAFLRLPYQATLVSNEGLPNYTLDSIIGNKSVPFTLNVYELDTYLNTLNPSDPSKRNSFLSDESYQLKPDLLNEVENMDFVPTTKDTLLILKRSNSKGEFFETDTIRYTSSANSTIPLPMAIIPLKKSFVKEVFLDNYGSSNFDSQNAFNNYFRGIKIEAKEKANDGGSLISFNLSNSSLLSAIDVYYTNTYFKKNSTEIDTVIKVNHSFQLGGIINSKYNMSNRVYPVNNQVKIQGAAGSEAKVEILQGSQLADLKAKNWLINDASLTFYINQNVDTTAAPSRLYIYKRGEDATSNPIVSQIKDVLSEGNISFGGSVLRENKKIDRYRFRITDYISDLLSGETSYSPPLRLKVFNLSDLPTSLKDSQISLNDTIFKQYNWNPKAVTLFNGDISANGVRRAQLKISYTKKK